MVDREEIEAAEREEHYLEAATAHPLPDTPGLAITEKDLELIRLYGDVRTSQVSWNYLVHTMPEEHLYWLAAHVQRPAGIEDVEWQKLQANAWRAQRAAERREMERAEGARLDLQREEGKRNRRTTVVTAILATLLGAGAALAGTALAQSDNGPMKVEITRSADDG